MGSLLVCGSTEEASWIYEKIQRPRSYLTVAMNVLYWKMGYPKVSGIVALMMEPVFGCNLRCSYCPWAWHDALPNLRPTLMDWEIFTEAVDKAAHSIETIQLCGLGEPTLHPRLCEMVDYIAEKGHRACLFTNGTRLTGTFLEDLARTRLSVLNLSIEPDDESCRQFRGVELKELRERIERFLALKRAESEVKIRMVVHEGNKHAVDASAASWKAMGIQVKLGGVFSMGESQPGFRCIEPWRGSLFVWTDGRVSPCAIDTFEDLVVGDITRQSYGDIVSSPAYKDLLMRFNRHDLPPRCSRCTETLVGPAPSLIPRLFSRRK